MIKRDGVAIMNARSNNVSIAKETIEICKQKRYTTPAGAVDLSASLDAAIKGTILYQKPLAPKNNPGSFDWQSVGLEVTNETTTQAAVRLMADGKTDVVALNFASARNPGGGFLGGAICQEEDLCRASGLYSCLKSKPVFYNENILWYSSYYTDNIIYSPKVPFFRDEYNVLMDTPYELSIISAPAPNVRAIEQINQLELADLLLNRAIKILQVAQANGHRNIILGAWGCGAFGNDPSMIANSFLMAFQQMEAFDHVRFAVLDTKPEQPTYQAFQQAVTLYQEQLCRL